jgi:hypothetical protein
MTAVRLGISTARLGTDNRILWTTYGFRVSVLTFRGAGRTVSEVGRMTTVRVPVKSLKGEITEWTQGDGFPGKAGRCCVSWFPGTE